jgi:outer membrane phospholipase A
MPPPALAQGEPKTVAPSTATAPTPSEPKPKPLPTAVVFFKEHFSPYEPFYFVAGPESPTAKFQISFKYRLLNSDGPLATEVPWLTGLHLGYTQTSLWDLDQPSSPFLDSSYKPELLYSLERVDRGQWADWFGLDLQTGLQHESNGREGLESRSLNIAYLRLWAQFGQENQLQFTVIPRAWGYLGSMTDNPDLSRYRGYVDLRTILGWEHGLQLSTLGRLGDHADKASAQFDLSYPLNNLFGGSFSWYLHAQYFIGYGESLLYYDERSSAIRFGFSLFR